MKAVDGKFTANLRKKKRKSSIVKQSQKCHLITVNPQGQFTTMEHYQDQDSVLYLNFSFNIDEGRECTEVLAAEEDPCIESIDQNPDTL